MSGSSRNFPKCQEVPEIMISVRDLIAKVQVEQRNFIVHVIDDVALASMEGLMTSVTRFWEFSPIGRVFTSRSFSKITEVALKLWLLFPFKTYAWILTKMAGLLFGQFLHKLIWSPCSRPICILPFRVMKSERIKNCRKIPFVQRFNYAIWSSCINKTKVSTIAKPNSYVQM
jgi:hypothetical protein